MKFTNIAPALVVGLCAISAVNYLLDGDWKHATLWAGFTIANFAAQL
jgi:hypothetical protein